MDVTSCACLPCRQHDPCLASATPSLYHNGCTMHAGRAQPGQDRRTGPLPEDLFLSPTEAGETRSNHNTDESSKAVQYNSIHQAPGQRLQNYLRQDLSETIHGTFEPSASSSPSSQHRQELKSLPAGGQQHRQEQNQQNQQHMQRLASSFSPAEPSQAQPRLKDASFISPAHQVSLQQARRQGLADEAFLTQSAVDPATRQQALAELQPSLAAQQLGLSQSTQQRLGTFAAAAPAGFPHADRILSKVQEPDVPQSSQTTLPSRPSASQSDYKDSSQAQSPSLPSVPEEAPGQDGRPQAQEVAEAERMAEAAELLGISLEGSALSAARYEEAHQHLLAVRHLSTSSQACLA